MEIIDALLKAMAIVFLLIFTLFLFSFLIEYVKMLWMKHKIKKMMMQQPSFELSEEAQKKISKILKKEIEKNEENE